MGWTAYADDVVTLEAALAGSTRVLVHPDVQREGVDRALVLAALEPYASVRQKVLLTDDEPRQRAFYESLGHRDTRDHDAGSLRAFIRYDR